MPTQDPEAYPLAPVQANVAAWEANVQANNQSLNETLRGYDLTIATQGDTATPSAIEIQLKDLAGEDQSGFTDILRVRVCDGYADAANATIAAAGGTTLLETITAGTDLIFESDANGLFEFDLTDGTAETVTLRIGPPPLGGFRASYRGAWEVTHAAP